ncbi:hypothetical protein GCM10009647_091480 [Streptomyces sanglieri]
MTRLVPETYASDTVFLYASKVVHDLETDRWTLYIDPENCLAGEDTTDVETLRNESPTISEEGSQRIFEGRMLFSSGIVFLVNDRFTLLQRDEAAPSDPGRWTSPAGRCEHDPATTALEEFYEELVATTDERPMFVRWDGRSGEYVETYQSTLSKLGNDTPADKWRSIRATVPNPFRQFFSTVVTQYGEREFRDELLTYYDEDANTLEFRFVLRISPSSELESQLTFTDGEFNRDVDLFTLEEVQSMSSENLVPTDAYIAREILPSIDDL